MPPSDISHKPYALPQPPAEPEVKMSEEHSWGDKSFNPKNQHRAPNDISVNVPPPLVKKYPNPRDGLTTIISQPGARVTLNESSATELGPGPQFLGEEPRTPCSVRIGVQSEVPASLWGDREFVSSKWPSSKSTALVSGWIGVPKVTVAEPLILPTINDSGTDLGPHVALGEIQVVTSPWEVVVPQMSGDPVGAKEVEASAIPRIDDTGIHHKLKFVEVAEKSVIFDSGAQGEKLRDSNSQLTANPQVNEELIVAKVIKQRITSISKEGVGEAIVVKTTQKSPETSKPLLILATIKPDEVIIVPNIQAPPGTTNPLPIFTITKPTENPKSEYTIPATFDPFKYGRPGTSKPQAPRGIYEGREIYGARPITPEPTPDPRTITIKSLPTNPTLSMISTICKGAGQLETITLFKTMKKARVSFVNSTDAKTFFDKTGNGVEFTYTTADGTSITHSVFVRMKYDLNFLSSATRYLVRYKKATRTILIVGWDRESLEYLVGVEEEDESYEGLLIQLAKIYSYTALDQRVEGVKWRKNKEGVLEGLLIYARIKDAYCALGAMLLEEELQGCKISYGKDP